MALRSISAALGAAVTCALSLPGHALAGAGPTLAECNRMQGEIDNLNAQAHQLRGGEEAAVRASGQAMGYADKIRSLNAYQLSMQRMRAEAEVQRQQELRAADGDISPFSSRGAYIGRLQVWVEALKDAERNAQTAGLTAGLVDGARNAEDAFAQRLRDRSIDLGHKAQEIERQARDLYLARQDCLARAAYEARNDPPLPDDQLDVDVGRMLLPNTDRAPMSRLYDPPPPSETGRGGGGGRQRRGQGDMPGWDKQAKGDGQDAGMPGWSKQSKRNKQDQGDMPGWGKQDKAGKKGRNPG